MMNTNTPNPFDCFLDAITERVREVVAIEVQKALDRESEKKRVQKTYTRKEVAEMAHVSLPTLWAHVKEGKITPLSNSSRRVIFSQESVEKYLKGGQR